MEGVGEVSVNVNLWFLVAYVRCEVLCRFVAAGNVFLLILIAVIFTSYNNRQRTSHRTYTTKNHKFTLMLPPSLQNETYNLVINIIVANS